MGINAYIVDPLTGKSVNVNSEREIPVVVHPHPPIDEDIDALPFSQYFTDDGFSTGSNDMVINGATTPTKFEICASNEFDIYVKNISVRISDNGAKLDKFGALAALSTGVKWYYQNQSIGELVLEEAITTNLDFFREATGGKGFGDSTTAFLADISGGGNDTYLPEIDLFTRFALQYGLRLRKGSLDCIGFEVRDNLAGISTFNIKGTGLRI